MENTETKKFQCSICGKVVEAKEISEDFKCPLCGAAHFCFKEIE